MIFFLFFEIPLFLCDFNLALFWTRWDTADLWLKRCAIQFWIFIVWKIRLRVGTVWKLFENRFFSAQKFRFFVIPAVQSLNFKLVEQDQFFGHIKRSSTSFDFLKLYSESGEKLNQMSLKSEFPKFFLGMVYTLVQSHNEFKGE